MKPREFFFWVRTAALFLVRSGRSTPVLSLMVVASVGVLIFLSALTVGVNDAMVLNSVGLYAGHITGTDLPAEVTPEELRVPGVRAVVRRFPVPGILRHGDRVEWVTLVLSDLAQEARATVLPRKLVEGRMPVAGEHAVLLGRATAERLAAHPGDEVSFRHAPSAPPSSLAVAGVYRTGVETLDGGLALGPTGAVPTPARGWSAAVFLREGVDPGAVVARYRALFGPAIRFQTWEERMPDLRQLIDLNYVSMGIVTVIVFGLVALGISCAFVIFILKNLREYGIVKAMGVTPAETTLLIGGEVVLMSLAAAALGVALGVATVLLFRRTGIDLTALTSHNRYFAVSGVVVPRLTPYSLWIPPTLAVLFSLAAAVWPAVTVVRSRTADVLRGR